MIAKGALDAFLARELDSFVWLKKLSVDQMYAELNHLKLKPVFKTEPWLHQLVGFYIGMYYPEFLFLLDMGAGKSKIMLDLMSHRQRQGKLKHALVTVPRLVNLGSWESDTILHSDLEPNLAEGSTEEKWERLLNPKGDVTIIDYPGLQLALTHKVKNGKKSKLERDDKRIAQLKRVYNFFTIDESHKAKNAQTLRFGILRQLTKNAQYRYATTGTLFGRNPEDIWAQFYLIDRGATFGESIGMFRSAFFNEVAGRFGTTYAFDVRQTRLLYRFLQNRSIRYTENEFSSLPDRVARSITVKFVDDQREHYLRAVEGLISARGSLREIDSAWLRMRQITSGYLEWRDETGKHQVDFSRNPKLEALERIIEESGDHKIVISTEFTKSGQLITELLTKLGYKFEWLYGGSKDPVRSVKRFMEDPTIKAFVMNSESGGTGTDGLQKVAHYLVFYESPVSPITRTQTLKRVHRPGQSKRTFIYDLVMEKSVDLRVLSFIAEGKSLMDSIVNGKITRDMFT